MPDPLEVQVPIIREVLDALRHLASIGADGYEADDVIGTLATGAGQPVDVVTGDRDLFQLVDDDAEVRVLYIARGVGRHERVDDEWVRAKYDVDARQYADFATLRGDASDGLPGVAGVGEKTAATLLARFGDLAGIIAAADDPASDLGPGPRSKIKAAADYLAVAPRVVAVARDDRPRPQRPSRCRPRPRPRGVAALLGAVGSGESHRAARGLARESAAPDQPARTVGRMTRIAVVGGHGKVAQHLLAALRRTEHTPVALVRKEEYRAELEALGAEVRLLDIEQHDADGFARAFEGCDAVVFAAGGGADGDIERKRTVDLEGSLKSIDGASSAGISRFVQVSAIGVDDAAARRHRRRLAGLRRGQARRRHRAARQRPRLDDHPAGRPHRRPAHRLGLPRERRVARAR